VELCTYDAYYEQHFLGVPLYVGGTMNDSEMLDWVQECLASLRHTMSDANPYAITYYDKNDEVQASHGESLRDCIAKAIAKEAL